MHITNHEAREYFTMTTKTARSSSELYEMIKGDIAGGYCPIISTDDTQIIMGVVEQVKIDMKEDGIDLQYNEKNTAESALKVARAAATNKLATNAFVIIMHKKHFVIILHKKHYVGAVPARFTRILADKINTGIGGVIALY